MSEENLSTNRVGLMGRNDEAGVLSHRTDAPLRVAATVKHCGFTGSRAKVQIFRSAEDFDRAGVVIRISMRNEDGEGFMPWARVTAQGVEVHIAGENEARAVMDALRVALALPEGGQTIIENQKGAPR
jgi:hypothetical protein